MGITPSTTLGDLQLEFGKLGIDSFVWNVLAGIHSITLIGDDGRVQGFGRDFVNALGDSLARYAEKLGLIIVMERSRSDESQEAVDAIITKYMNRMNSALDRAKSLGVASQHQQKEGV